ncbi:MAG: GNAT family N-acetyltransferase [Saprospiraceae bacterium]|jgi:ribosomal protein S18 acetylase RimI-like enzyme|nr:GNAT family N-acetyltransferase [Saprospiraceae bacterium]
MDDFYIEKVSAELIDDLRNISIQTFTEAFSDANSTENMSKYIEENMSLEKLQSEIHDINSEFYFCKERCKIIGYLKLNFQSQRHSEFGVASVELERIYVLKTYHGKQVAQKLINLSIELAKKRNADHIWLGVWENNHRAINFYSKNGFTAYDSHIFVLGDDAQRDILMKLRLK